MPRCVVKVRQERLAALDLRRDSNGPNLGDRNRSRRDDLALTRRRQGNPVEPDPIQRRPVDREANLRGNRLQRCRGAIVLARGRAQMLDLALLEPDRLRLKAKGSCPFDRRLHRCLLFAQVAKGLEDAGKGLQPAQPCLCLGGGGAPFLKLAAADQQASDLGLAPPEGRARGRRLGARFGDPRLQLFDPGSVPGALLELLAPALVLPGSELALRFDGPDLILQRFQLVKPTLGLVALVEKTPVLALVAQLREPPAR